MLGQLDWADRARFGLGQEVAERLVNRGKDGERAVVHRDDLLHSLGLAQARKLGRLILVMVCGLRVTAAVVFVAFFN